MTEYIPVEKTRKGYYAAWEQGGRIHPDFGGGEATVIVDDQGCPVVPVFVRTHSDRKNGFLASGKHALIILKPNYFIIKLRVDHLSEVVPAIGWAGINIQIFQIIKDYQYAFVENKEGEFYAVCEPIASKNSMSSGWDENYVLRNLQESININLIKAVSMGIKKVYCLRCTHAHCVIENSNKPIATRFDLLLEEKW